MVIKVENNTVSFTDFVITTCVLSVTIICIIIWTFKSIRRSNAIQDALEEMNDIMQRGIDDATAVIRAQDDVIRRLTLRENEDLSPDDDNVIHVLEAINCQKKRDATINQDGWNLYLVKRNENAPPVNTFDLHCVLVVATTPEQVITILKRNVLFTDDEWWDIIPVYLNSHNAGIVMSK